MSLFKKFHFLLPLRDTQTVNEYWHINVFSLIEHIIQNNTCQCIQARIKHLKFGADSTMYSGLIAISCSMPPCQPLPSCYAYTLQ